MNATTQNTMKTKLPPFDPEKMLAMSIGKSEQQLKAVVDTLTAENRELQDVAAKHRADNQRLREQVAQLTEALGDIEQLLDCGNIEQSHWDDCLGIARSALSAVERGQK